MILEDYIRARDGLIDKDLVAFDGTLCQVLSLPEKPLEAPKPSLGRADGQRRGPAWGRTFKQHPDFALPYKRYTLPTIMDSCSKYAEDAAADYRKIVRSVLPGYRACERHPSLNPAAHPAD